jgi:actin-related protein 5
VGATKAEYEEYGGERVRRWWGGNWNGEFSGEVGDAVQVDEFRILMMTFGKFDVSC